jgi:hypothetical protein
MEHRLKPDADSQPAAPATASEPSREDRRAEALATRRVAQTRAMTWTAAVIGAGIFLSFGAVDVALHAVLYPEGSLLAALVWRAVGMVGLVAIVAATRLEGRPVTFYHRATSGGLALTGLALGVIGSELGGLEGPNAIGVLFIVAGTTSMLPSPWRVSLSLIGPSFVAMFAGLLVGVATHEAYAPQLGSAAALTAFGFDVLMFVSLSAFSVVGADRQWRTNAQLADARRLGRYRLESRLGAGGMNEVWLARELGTQRPVALKLLRGADSDEGRLARFEREAQLTSRLGSPHTVRILDFGTNPIDGSAWIAMEKLDGRDLAELIANEGALEVARVLRLARHAALSLAEAHAAGLVHRDIKPANLFVCDRNPERDWLKVIDFGIARDVRTPQASLTQTGFIIGTPAYMAPEQLLGQPATPRSDVYALGACLHAMLTGLGGPWERLEGAELLSLERRGQIPAIAPLRREEVPPRVERLVARCLAPDPASRPSDGAAVVAALDALAATDGA